MEDLTGKQLGLYQIIAPLGEGGMATVYKAYQLGKMNRYVALKVLPQQLAKQPQFIKRFNQEANVLAKLQHPRILPVFDFGEAKSSINTELLPPGFSSISCWQSGCIL